MEEYSSGVCVELPFQVIVGKVREPRLLLIAGVHGDEYEGVAALHDLASELDPQAVSGTITIVPVANPLAFHAGARRAPSDFGDLNRAFPGDASGSVTSRLAHLLFEEFVKGNQCLLSLHGWSKEANLLAYAEYPDEASEAGRISREAALATGMTYFHPYKWPAGVLGDAALALGISAVETEVGGMGIISQKGQYDSRRLVLGFLNYWGVLPQSFPGVPLSQPRPSIVDHSDVFANRAGLFRSRAQPGQTVEQGASLGSIRGLDGDVLEELFCPRTGIIAILRTFASVQPGDRLVQVFWEP